MSSTEDKSVVDQCINSLKTFESQKDTPEDFKPYIHVAQEVLNIYRNNPPSYEGTTSSKRTLPSKKEN
jgi:hypothetical protein